MQFIPIALYLFLCLLIGFAGRHSRLGGVGFFLVSLVFTPLFVGIILALTRPGAASAVARRVARPQNSR